MNDNEVIDEEKPKKKTPYNRSKEKSWLDEYYEDQEEEINELNEWFRVETSE